MLMARALTLLNQIEKRAGIFFCAACGELGRQSNRGRQKRMCERCKSAQESAHRPCVVCGSVSPPSARRRTFCSGRCYRVAIGRRAKKLHRLAARHGCSGAGWREQLIGVLRERDGSLCGICHEPISFGLKSGWTTGDPSGDGPSIDHVIPYRHDDAEDEIGNLRLTHWRCNAKRRRPAEVA